MALAINITLRFRSPSSRETVTDFASRVIEKRLTQAMKRIQAQWPVDTGLSKRSFTLVKRSPLLFALVNNAARRGREYAGYVHRKGNRTPLRLTLIPSELAVAQQQIDEDLRAGLPSVVRDAIRRTARSSAAYRSIDSRLGRFRL